MISTPMRVMGPSQARRVFCFLQVGQFMFSSILRERGRRGDEGRR